VAKAARQGDHRRRLGRRKWLDSLFKRAICGFSKRRARRPISRSIPAVAGTPATGTARRTTTAPPDYAGAVSQNQQRSKRPAASSGAEAAIANADVVGIATPARCFAKLDAAAFRRSDKRCVVLDCWRVLRPEVADVMFLGRG
jgi:hypothetical protein